MVGDLDRSAAVLLCALLRGPAAGLPLRWVRTCPGDPDLRFDWPRQLCIAHGVNDARSVRPVQEPAEAPRRPLVPRSLRFDVAFVTNLPVQAERGNGPVVAGT